MGERNPNEEPGGEAQDPLSIAPHLPQPLKTVTITIQGRLAYPAQRQLKIDVSEGLDPRCIKLHWLNELADFDQVPWNLGDVGYMEALTCSVDNLPASMDHLYE